MQRRLHLRARSGQDQVQALWWQSDLRARSGEEDVQTMPRCRPLPTQQDWVSFDFNVSYSSCEVTPSFGGLFSHAQTNTFPILNPSVTLPVSSFFPTLPSSLPFCFPSSVSPPRTQATNNHKTVTSPRICHDRVADIKTTKNFEKVLKSSCHGNGSIYLGHPDGRRRGPMCDARRRDDRHWAKRTTSTRKSIV